MIETFEDNLDLEPRFLRPNIYNTTSINILLQTINPHNRFKKRIVTLLQYNCAYINKNNYRIWYSSKN
ncbi:hypothetical protein A3305_07650 (plasmid) [Rickettsia amblyommatis]|nr:hypothetical protein A3305_07650 [Rickettsia amblyommatis]